MFGHDIAFRDSPRIKICGLTNEGDAIAAAELGADALGFNFFPGSKRYLKIDSAMEWIRRLPHDVAKVAVLVNPTLEEALQFSAFPFFAALQLHGAETPDFCRRLAEREVRFAKAIPVSEGVVNSSVKFFTDIVILDSSTGGVFGGSGLSFPWEIAREYAEANRKKKVILAGGLTPENISEAIATARPFGVDVTSGIESSPGRKNHARMRAFVDAARG